MIAEIYTKGFYLKGVYSSKISKYSYLLYPDYNLCNGIRIKHKLWIHSDIDDFQEYLKHREFIYGKFMVIRINQSGVHVSVRHIPDEDVPNPYIIIQADCISGEKLIGKSMNFTNIIRIVIKPTENCPPHVFNAWKISQMITNVSKIMYTLF